MAKMTLEDFFIQVFALCDTKPAGKTCPAIKGILEDGDEDIKEARSPVTEPHRLGQPARH